MSSIQSWTEFDKLEFRDKTFDYIGIADCKARPNPENYDFNTELIFDNCIIDCINAATVVVGRKFTFRDCIINELNFHATYFCKGFEMTNCVIEEHSNFNSGTHNKAPYEFIIQKCIFKRHLDFFDIMFDGPVIITHNEFVEGTNLGSYFAIGTGNKNGFPYIIENNKGDLKCLAADDPYLS